MYTEINKCRICGNTNLEQVLDLGEQMLTGVFPCEKGEKLTVGPLRLVKCMGADDVCGLLQLEHSYDSEEMYGENYGYRSGLNSSMVAHLHDKVKKIIEQVELNKGDLIIDIGSNDSTLLQAYPREGLDLVGMDPTGEKFKKYYPEHIKLIPEFFSSESFKKNFGERKAKVVTSIAMFYDLERPLDFVRQVHEILADDGIWVFEQSYLPTMLEMNAYDTVCHEHLEYYCLKQIKWMAEQLEFKIVDVELNEINGGSFSVTIAKSTSAYPCNTKFIEKILQEEAAKELHTIKPYDEFKKRVLASRSELMGFIQKVKSENKCLLGYGASTKGNVILQFCDLGTADIPAIAEVNVDKYGCYTPNTNIPIISEEDVKKMNPDYLLVFPWHFKDNIIDRETEYLNSGGKLVFPLPHLEVVQK
ncbi:MAG: class I SAM-dependent methyltransferase [PVC group bacterium]|nr:class I SAM-dependent methyltransferase [PVC group bacterium]